MTGQDNRRLVRGVIIGGILVVLGVGIGVTNVMLHGVGEQETQSVPTMDRKEKKLPTGKSRKRQDERKSVEEVSGDGETTHPETQQTEDDTPHGAELQPDGGEQPSPVPAGGEQPPLPTKNPASVGTSSADDAEGDSTPGSTTASSRKEEPPAQTTDQTGAGDHSTPESDDKTVQMPEGTISPTETPTAAYTGDLVMYGGGSGTPAQRALWSSWITHMIERGETKELVPMLEERIRQIAPELIVGERLNYSAYKNSRILMDAVELCLLTELVGAERLDNFMAREKKGEASKNSPDQFMRWLLLDRSRPLHRLLQAFVYHSGIPESFARTLKVFYTLWKRAPERDRTRYMNLAIACALVREEVAHSRGMLRVPDEKLLDIPELYDFFRKQDVANALLTNIQKLSVTELLHVVDVRLPLSEFQWVKTHLDYQRQNWGATYSRVQYLMERATQNVDPYVKYTLAEILEEGGVCRDQAYFCATSAKTRGLPAVIITGDGDRGPHEWVALYTSEKNGWTTSGSYGYKTGRYQDPCSGLILHESALLDRDKKLTQERLEPALNCMVLSDYLCRIQCKNQAMGAARYVTIAFPQLTVSWRNLVAVMELCGEEAVNMSAWRRLYMELTHQSKKNKELLDLMQAVQNDHVMEGKRDNVRMNALKQSSRKLDELVQIGRIDLVVESLQRQAEIYVNQGDYRGLSGFFKPYLKGYASKPNVFGEVLELYMRVLDECADKIRNKEELDEKRREQEVRALWRVCAKDADSVYSKNAFSSEDFFAIKKEAGIMRSIAECWRLAGNEKRAMRLEEVAEENYERSRERNTNKKREPPNTSKRHWES